MSTTHPPSSHHVYTGSLPCEPLPSPPSYQHLFHPITYADDRRPEVLPSVLEDGFHRPDPRDSVPIGQQRKTHPATIAELASKSREDLWDPSKDLKHRLRTVELARKSGKQYADDRDYERSFIQFSRAASIILEKMPTHKDYYTRLTTSQRNK